MMIRPDNEELTRAIEIALTTAKPYALRGLFTPTRALNREVAIQTLSQRILTALRPYEITRQPNAYEQGDRTLPLFPYAREDSRKEAHSGLPVGGRPLSRQA